MIAEQPAKLLVAQVASELSAHQTYMGISLYFARESLNGWAKFFHDQSTEEAEHGGKIIALPHRQRRRVQPAAGRRRADHLRVGPRGGRGRPGERGQGHRAVRGAGQRRPGREGQPDPPVRPVVHRGAGGGGAHDGGAPGPHRQRHQPVPGRGPARRDRGRVAGSPTGLEVDPLRAPQGFAFMTPEAFERYLRDLEAADAFSGVVRITVGDEERFAGAYGFASRAWRVRNTLETRFDTASITKLFTAVAALQQVDAGAFGLETSAVAYLGLEGHGDLARRHRPPPPDPHLRHRRRRRRGGRGELRGGLAGPAQLLRARGRRLPARVRPPGAELPSGPGLPLQQLRLRSARDS